MHTGQLERINIRVRNRLDIPLKPRNQKKAAKMAGFYAGSRAPRTLILAPVELTGLKV